MRSGSELKRLVKEAKECKDSGMRITDIVKKLKISNMDACLFCQGYSSVEDYERDYLKLKGEYNNLIKGRLEKLLFLGWPLKTIEISKSVKLSFLEQPEKKVLKRDLRAHLRRNIEEKLKEEGKDYLLKDLADEISVRYYNKFYRLLPKTLRARAFLEFYGNLVFKREIGKESY
jgi:hypothetical protein